MDENPRLNRNLLNEALLEIRFAPVKDLALIIGKLNSRLQDYPEFVDLKIPDMMMDVPEMNNLVRYRFFSKDRKNLYNLGNGILSINTVQYPGFKNFTEKIAEVLNAYKEVAGASEITRIGLRYINQFDCKDKKLSDIFTISFNMPDNIFKEQIAFNLQTIGKSEENSMLMQFRTLTPESSEQVILDIENFSLTKREFNIDSIKEWISTTHDKIYTTFRSSLTEEYFEEIRSHE